MRCVKESNNCCNNSFATKVIKIPAADVDSHQPHVCEELMLVVNCWLAVSGLRLERKLPRYCSWGIPEEGREIGHGLLYPAGPDPTPEPTQYLYSTFPSKTITPPKCGAGG